MKLKEIDVLEIDKHDLIECITNYQGLGYILGVEPKETDIEGAFGRIIKSIIYKVTILKEVEE
ncbi:hypothetical protein [Carnobacterium divergens]|uniref:hypothetical protein n=1 Tax=Carnobacterium divergens TaxID=2748 RepID=UPI0039B06307